MVIVIADDGEVSTEKGQTFDHCGLLKSHTKAIMMSH